MAEYNAVASLLCSAGLLLSVPAVYAGDQETPSPTLAFLEYLGEWQDDDGQPIDPLVFGKDDTPKSDVDLESDAQ